MRWLYKASMGRLFAVRNLHKTTVTAKVDLCVMQAIGFPLYTQRYYTALPRVVCEFSINLRVYEDFSQIDVHDLRKS